MTYTLLSVSNRVHGHRTYELKSIYTGETKECTRQEILDILSHSHTITNIKLSSDNKILTRNILYDPWSQSSPNITTVTGENLFTLCRRGSRYTPRKQVWQIIDTLKTNYVPMHITVLSGIRRTGKTTAIYQAITHLLSSGTPPTDIVFLDIKPLCQLDELLTLVSSYKNKIIFIDEITRIPGIALQLSQFSDTYSLTNKLVLTGTDSYVFTTASEDSLYDRAQVINFTTMAYNEYLSIFNAEHTRLNLTNQEKIERYIIEGGALSKSEHSTPYRTYSSIKSSIIGNIINTVRRNQDYDSTPAYAKYFAAQDTEKLAYTIIRIILDSCNISGQGRDKILKPKVLNKQAYSFIQSIEDRNGQVTGKTWHDKTEQEKEYNNISSELINSTSRILAELNISAVIRNLASTDSNFITSSKYTYERICLIPSILFSLATQVTKGLNTTETCKPQDLKDAFRGLVVENLVISQCILAGYDTRFLRFDITPSGLSKYKETNSTPEIDCVITKQSFYNAPEYIAIEIKSGNSPKPEYAKNLKNRAVSHLLGTFQPLVIYFGKTTQVQGIPYINIHDFLINIPKYLGNIEKDSEQY